MLRQGQGLVGSLGYWVSKGTGGKETVIRPDYGSKPPSYFGHPRTEVLALLDGSESFPEALEIGCGSGETLALLLRSGKVGRAVGVEPVHQAAVAAQEQLSLVLEVDVEEWARHPTGVGRAGLVIAADVLEHLFDPWTLLKRIRQLQSIGGVLLLSIPNIQHYTVSFALLALGRWRYVDEGLLDRTHLRFFTRRGIHAMVVEAGYEVERWGFTAGPRGKLAVGLSGGMLRPWV